MKALISRAVFRHLSSPPPPSLASARLSLLFLHAAAGDETHRRRSDGPSSAPSSSFASSSRRHHEEESRGVKVSVWWDFENCNVPVGVNVFRVANRITSALRASGIKGPVTITAFGDVAQLSRATQEALTSTGVCLTHVPHSGKNSSDRSFMADLVYWVSLNPPPIHFFLISGDRDFANILHRLRMSNYNILLASPDTAPGVLCSAATIMWSWPALVKGENLSVKHFNYPPDGFYASWYGHYKGVLDDPFLDMERSTNLLSEESTESLSENRPRPIPKAAVNGIRHVLYSYPEGISLSELRAELRRNNITMDKDFFGHRKFSHLLASMPNILKFIPHPSGEGQPLVIGVHRKAVESIESSAKPPKEIGSTDGVEERSLTQDGKSLTVVPPISVSESSSSRKDTIVDTGVGKSILPEEPDSEVEDGRSERILKTFSTHQTPKADPSSRGTNGGTIADSSTSQKGHDDAVEEGFFKRIWKALSGTMKGHPDERKDTIYEVDSTAREDSGKDAPALHNKHSEKAESDDKDAQLNNVSSDLPSSGSNYSEANKSLSKDEAAGQSEKQNDMRVSFFSQISSWWKSWKVGAEGQEDSSATFEKVTDNQEINAYGESSNALTNVSCQPETHDLFSKAYFWDALESFLLTSKGSDLISKSRTRGQLVHGLQKEGPWILKDLKERHLVQLVDLLISEKKWLEEYASLMFPFELKFPAKRKCVPSHAHACNGLSSLFTERARRAPQTSLRGLPNQEKQDQNSGPCGSLYDGSSDAKPPQTFAELKAWFQKTYSGKEHVEPEDMQNLFESKFNRKLVYSFYGYASARSLIAACLTDDANNQGKKKRPLNREEILSDCHKLLSELFEEYPDGFNMSIFRPAFIQRYGYVLDYKMLGYPKLVSLLQIMPGLRIESTYILPAEKFQSASSREKPAFCGILSNSLSDDTQVVSLDNEGQNGEDCVWEELGPVSDTVSPENNSISEEMDKELTYDRASLSDEEFSDSEGDIPSDFGGSDSRCKKGEEDSSLLQILDSWYSSKEGGGKEKPFSVDGLVDCSKSNEENSMDLKSTNSQKPMLRPQRRYSFVAESGEDDKEKLVESILGSLKKAGDSRLQS